jgi:hypothetical protein
MSRSLRWSRLAIAILLAPCWYAQTTALAQPHTYVGASGESWVDSNSDGGSGPEVVISDGAQTAPNASDPSTGWATGPSEYGGMVGGEPRAYPGYGDYAPGYGYDGNGEDSGPGGDPGYQGDPAPSRWYASAEALVLDRNNETGRRVLVGQDVTFDVLLRTNDFEFSPEGGPRVTVGYTPCGGASAWEASYFGIFDWDENETLRGDNDLILPGDLGIAANLDFFDSDVVRCTYSSEIQNAEFNHLWKWSDNIWLKDIVWLAGFRYFRLDDHFNITSTDVQTGSSQYDISAINNLYGFQLGARVNFETPRLWWDFTGKVGAYGNDSSQHQRVDDFAGFVLRDAGDDDRRMAFVGDVGLSAAYQINSHVWLRGGINFMWVEGVALAPNQLDFTDTIISGTDLNDEGGVFYGGGSVGLIVRR